MRSARRAARRAENPDLLKKVKQAAASSAMDMAMAEAAANVGFSGGEKKRGRDPLQMKLLEAKALRC